MTGSSVTHSYPLLLHSVEIRMLASGALTSPRLSSSNNNASITFNSLYHSHHWQTSFHAFGCSTHLTNTLYPQSGRGSFKNYGILPGEANPTSSLRPRYLLLAQTVKTNQEGLVAIGKASCCITAHIIGRSLRLTSQSDDAILRQDARVLRKSVLTLKYLD